MITQEYVRELFDYDEVSGKLTWKVNRGSRGRIGNEAGTIQPDGYRRVAINGKTCAAHRLIWFYQTGKWPKDQIDHINGIRDDNRFCNLREANNSQNMMNIKKPNSNTSGHKNICKRVTKNIHNGKAYWNEYWRVQIISNDKNHTKLFPYTDEGLEQAIAYRDEMLPILHGEFAHNG